MKACLLQSKIHKLGYFLLLQILRSFVRGSEPLSQLRFISGLQTNLEGLGVGSQRRWVNAAVERVNDGSVFLAAARQDLKGSNEADVGCV